MQRSGLEDIKEEDELSRKDGKVISSNDADRKPQTTFQKIRHEKLVHDALLEVQETMFDSERR